MSQDDWKVCEVPGSKAMALPGAGRMVSRSLRTARGVTNAVGAGGVRAGATPQIAAGTHVPASGTRQTAARARGVAKDGVHVGSSSPRTFVGTPRGTAYDIPQGWAPRVAENGKWIVYQRPGASGNADMIPIAG